MKLLLIPDPTAPNGEDALCREVSNRAGALGHHTTIRPVPNGPLEATVESLTASGFAADADIVIVNSLQPAAMAATRAASRKLVVRMIDSYHGCSPQTLSEIGKTLLQADLILVPSAYMEKTILGWMGEDNGHHPRHMIRRVPYAYDKIRAKEISLITMRASRPRGFGVVAAAPLNDINRPGLETLISAVSRLRLDCHLTIVGEGPGQPRLEEFSRQVVAADKVRFRGNMEHGKLMEYFRAAKVYVDPCSLEGFPMLTLHALSEGCPVIGARAGAMEEFIEHDSNGLLFPPGDAVALSECIMTLASEQGLSLKLIGGGIKTVERHSWDDTARAVFAALEALKGDS